MYCVFFFKQKTAYEMRISDWSSDVCSSDLTAEQKRGLAIKRTTGNGPSEMAPEATREFRRQQHRRVTRVELACTQSRGGTMARGPADLRRSHQLARHA